MARLIDAEALYAVLEEMSHEPDYQHPDEDWNCGVAMAQGAVEEAPTVDAVEVVRCKDCKYFANSFDPGGERWCSNFYGLETVKKNGNDFCSYGERRSDNAAD